MEVIKNNILKTALIAMGLLLAGTLVVGITTARADGGTCRVKIADICLGEFKAGVLEIQEFFDAPEEDVLGAIPGNSVNSPDFGVNGVTVHYRNQGFFHATGTLCILRAPNATTTLTHLSAGSTNTVTSAGDVTVYSAPTKGVDTPDAVVLAGYLVAENEFIGIAATSTGTLISPLNFIVFDYSNATSTLSLDTRGGCNVELTQIN